MTQISNGSSVVDNHSDDYDMDDLSEWLALKPDEFLGALLNPLSKYTGFAKNYVEIVHGDAKIAAMAVEQLGDEATVHVFTTHILEYINHMENLIKIAYTYRNK